MIALPTRLAIRLGAVLVLGSTLSVPFSARAQSTAEQEAANRANVLRTTPDWAAKVQFGRQSAPAPLAARAIGSYAKGCLAGAVALPVDGQTWQVMRLQRNRNWGHPDLVALVERLAREAPGVAGWPGILVGDISQPRGGPMLTGHASHQIGLDADIWLTPMPERRLGSEERENISAVNMVRPDWMDVDPAAWTPAHGRLVRAAAMKPEVERIFVNPAIKRAMCREATGNRNWMSKVRPMWGHNYHFHIRIACPDGMEGCQPQAPVPGGDGCGKELDDWLALQNKAIFAPKRPPRPGKPRPPMSVDALPPACRDVLVAR